MDYIALNHNTTNLYGVHYNSPQPIGGIRYYSPDEKPVQANPKTGKTIVTIAVPKPQLPEPNKTSSIPEPKKIESSKAKIKKVTYEDLKEEIQGNSFKETEELITKENLKEELEREREEKKEYIVSIQGIEVNFSETGIKKRRLSRSERKWLRKAQNYFLTVEENGRKIGSAESYTTMEILEALWRTAEEVDIDPKRFIVQMYNETRFNPNLVGRAGERGLGQFKRSTAEYHGYNWKQMTNGIHGYAYQAKAAAEFVKQVGEVAYNGGSNGKANKYQDKISQRIDRIDDWDSGCAMKTIAHCSS